MRKFSLYLDGVETPLNGEDGIWFTDPTGLGATLNPAMVDLRNGFFRSAAEDIIPQMPIVGTMTFPNWTLGQISLSAYDYYNLFLRILLAAKKIELGYTPSSTLTPVEYRIRVKLNYITKTEMTGNWLKCPISFAPLTPWYKETPIDYEFLGYGGGLIAHLDRVVGDVPATIRLTITGTGDIGNVEIILIPTGAASPSQYVALEGELLPNGGTIIYSSAYDDAFITADDGSEITDLVNIVDVTENPWIRIDSEAKYDLILQAAGLRADDTYELKLYQYYRSV